MRTNVDACRTHEEGRRRGEGGGRGGEGGGVGGGVEGVRHNQVCARVDSEGQKNCPSPCPTTRSNPVSWDQKSDAVTTELRPPSGTSNTIGERCPSLFQESSLSLRTRRMTNNTDNYSGLSSATPSATAPLMMA